MEGGGRTSACPWWEGVGASPPPLEIGKKEAVRGNFNLFHLYRPPPLMNSWTCACMAEFVSPTW